MYLVHLWKKDIYLFLDVAPPDSMDIHVEEGVTYEASEDDLAWADGEPAPIHVLGRKDKEFKLFTSDKKCRQAGYIPFATNFAQTYYDMDEYLRENPQM